MNIEHLRQSENTLKVLQLAEVSLKLCKCNFFSNTVQYLGHVMRSVKLSIADVHVMRLAGIQHPQKITEPWSFLAV